jgi:hypothetical protein
MPAPIRVIIQDFTFRISPSVELTLLNRTRNGLEQDVLLRRAIAQPGMGG